MTSLHPSPALVPANSPARTLRLSLGAMSLSALATALLVAGAGFGLYDGSVATVIAVAAVAFALLNLGIFAAYRAFPWNTAPAVAMCSFGFAAIALTAYAALAGVVAQP